MSARKDFIPQNAAAFDKYFKNLTLYVMKMCAGNTPIWPHIPKKDIENLEKAFENWTLDYTPTLTPHAPFLTAERNRAKKEAEKFLRSFINRFLRHEPVTDGQRDEMGVPNPKKSRTMHFDVLEVVSFVFRIAKALQVIIDFRIEGSDSRAKPDSYDGAVIFYAVLDRPPASHAELTESILATHSPFILSFDITQRGKTVYVAMAWQNKRGRLGKKSPIQSTLIP